MLTRSIRLSVAALGATCLAVAAIGCASQPARPEWPAQGGGDPAPPSTSRAEKAGSEEILAAVEAFLEQTVDYHSAGAQNNVRPTGSPPRAPSIGAAVPPGRSVPTGVGALPAGVAVARPGVVANVQVAINDAPVTRPSLALPVLESVSILDPSAKPGEVSLPSTKVKTANEPLAATPPEDAVSLDRFVSYLEAEAGDGNDFDTEWRLRMTLIALQRDQEALEISPQLPREARDVLASFVRLAAAVRRAARDPLADGSETLAALAELRGTVADRADPEVSAVALCRKVVTFGVYEEMGAADFLAGRTIQTIVYSEIRGFQSEATEDGQFRTRLATRLEVLSADGRSAWQHEEPEIVDVCRRARSDFFIAQRIALPPTLSAGAYVLKVWVEDKLSGRSSEATHAFSVASAAPTTQSG